MNDTNESKYGIAHSTRKCNSRNKKTASVLLARWLSFYSDCYIWGDVQMVPYEQTGQKERRS